MPSVTAAFAHALARAAGLTTSKDGVTLSDGTIIQRLHPDSNGRIPDKEYFALIEWIQATQEDEVKLVAKYAESIRPDDLGVLGLAIKTAPTLRASLKLVERYFLLMTDNVVYRLEENSDQALLTIAQPDPVLPVVQLRNECALAAFARNMRCFVETELNFDFVSFRHACRSNPHSYDAFFGCAVMFDAESDAIALPIAALDLPNKLGDEGVCDFLIQHLEGETSKLNADTPLVKTLMTYLSKRLRDGVPQAVSVANEMGMSERTLYRRLADEGLTFRDVLQRAQTTLAQKLLSASDCSIAEVAFLTGFSEQSTFSRAFKRWVGQAPGQYRQEAKAA